MAGADKNENLKTWPKRAFEGLLFDCKRALHEQPEKLDLGRKRLP